MVLKARKITGRLSILITGALLLPPFLSYANAPQPEKGCQADEIHWTINGPQSISFDWRGEASEIRYGITNASGLSARGSDPSPMPFSSPRPFRQVLLKSRKPGTTYHYAIGNCGGHTFHTPPAPGTSGFVVDVEGDIGASTNYSDVVPDQRLVASHMPALVLVLGDLTYGNPNGQAAVDRHFNDMMVWSQDTAYMPSWGNHEWDVPKFDDLRNYKGRFKLPHAQASPGAPAAGGHGQDWSWFDYGNARFIAYPEPYSSATWPAWYKKAKRIMDQAQADPNITFIATFGHRPPYTSGYHKSSMVLRRELLNLAEHHSKYVLNVNGHNHDYERSYPQHGLVSVTAGIGGSELEESHTACLFRKCPKPTWSAFRAMHFGILRLSFTNSRIEGSFLCGPAGGGKNDVQCESGSVIDHFTIEAKK